MAISLEIIEDILEDFTITGEQIKRTARYFQKEIAYGLNGLPTSLQMLKSYMRMPKGNETGDFLALDFGGTNIRVLLVRLKDRKFQIIKKVQKPLTTKEYDYTSSTVTGTRLFDFIAGLIGEVAEPQKTYQLGHTFSFGTAQDSLDDARLICWSKEIKVSGVEGELVNSLLKEALARRGLNLVQPVAILNDTVAAALAAAYLDAFTDIGSICGTGHNTTYLEYFAGCGEPMFINLEAGGFNRLPFNRYDVLLDGASKQPGHQLLEKMASGKYLGKILHFVLKTALGCSPAYELDGKQFAEILGGESESIGRITSDLGLPNEPDSAVFLKRLVIAIVVRSAQLVAATYIGILLHVDAALEKRHSIVIDGSLYEKMPHYAQVIRGTVDLYFGESKARKIEIRLEKDGSGVGAAIAAAVAVSTSH